MDPPCTQCYTAAVQYHCVVEEEDLTLTCPQVMEIEESLLLTGSICVGYSAEWCPWQQEKYDVMSRMCNSSNPQCMRSIIRYNLISCDRHISTINYQKHLVPWAWPHCASHVTKINVSFIAQFCTVHYTADSAESKPLFSVET